MTIHIPLLLFRFGKTLVKTDTRTLSPFKTLLQSSELVTRPHWSLKRFRDVDLLKRFFFFRTVNSKICVSE